MSAPRDDRDARSADLLRLLGEVIGATQSGSANDAVAAVLAQVCAAMGWSVGHAWRVSDDGQLEPTDIWYPANTSGYEALVAATSEVQLGPGHGLPGRVLAERRPHWIADIQQDPNFPRLNIARDLRVRSALAFPVVVGEQVYAVLEFFSEIPSEPDADLLALMASVGAHVGHVFQRIERDGVLRESAERFRALADNAAEAIVAIDIDDHINYANPATTKIFGWSLDELRTMTFSQLMPERFRDRHRAGIQRFAASGVRNIPWDGIELPGLHRDGHEVPLEVTFGHFTRNGRHFFNGIMRDITERRRAEEERTALLESERTARAAAEEARGEAERRARQEQALRQAAAAVSSTFTVEETSRQIAQTALDATHADGAFVQQIDIEAGELHVIAIAGELAPPIGSRRPYAGSATATVIEREAPLVIERLGSSSYPLHPLLPVDCGDCSAAVIPLLNAGEPIGSLILIRRAERAGFRPDELARAFTFGELAALAFRKIHLLEDSERRRAELERVMESRARLMRGFSHDVRNPLGAVDGFLELLREGVLGDLTEKQIEIIERARRSLGAGLGLIDDLLELARAEAGQLEIRVAPSDVREAVRELTEEYRLRAEAAELSIHIDVPNDFPVIQSDPARVRQIVGNLLSNAVKYTPAGGRIDVSVYTTSAAPMLRTRAKGGWAVARIADTGAGIPNEKLQLLFQEFTRLQPEVGTGAGIGLAISRRIARALGGDITVNSELGRGSIFELWLPITGPGEGAVL